MTKSARWWTNCIDKRVELADLESVQSVQSSQSKHISAALKSLHSGVSQPCNTVPGGGVGWSFPTEPGQSGLIIGSAPAGDIQSFMSFAPIPHLTKHAAVRVPDMLCLSGHLDVHLVGRGACLSISLPDGLALITPSYVSPPRAANADSAAAFEASAARCCRVRGIKRWFVRQGEQRIR